MLKHGRTAPPPLDSGRRTRIVDRLIVHGSPITFRELCERAVPPQTRYLVLDLDRTIHLGRNMGELLGWELCALQGYGLDHLTEAEPRRPRSRLFFDWSRPARVLRYLALTARTWARPGLLYLLFGKLPARFEIARWATFRTFGPEPVAAVQQVPQLALFRQMSAVPTSVPKMLARRVWDRYAGDQIVERADLDWLRSRCPNLRIVMTSASPQPSLEVAAEMLGIDDVIYSALDERGGHLGAPYQLGHAFTLSDTRGMAGLRYVRFNSGRAKIEALLERYPDLGDPAVVSVGISDTGYGEDHCWAGHFTRVVDVNSSTPFPVVVPAASPVEELHSAAVLTRSERMRRAGGDPSYLDRRRSRRLARDHVFASGEVRERLGRAIDEMESLAGRYAEHARGLADARSVLQRERERLERRLVTLATGFSESSEGERAAIATQLRRHLRELRALRRRLARLERPLSQTAFEMTGLLARSRAALT